MLTAKQEKWQFTYQGIKCKCIKEKYHPYDCFLFHCEYNLNGMDYFCCSYYEHDNKLRFRNEVENSILRLMFPEEFPEKYKELKIPATNILWRIWNYVRGK